MAIAISNSLEVLVLYLKRPLQSTSIRLPVVKWALQIHYFKT
jgi:hypothetical protein